MGFGSAPALKRHMKVCEKVFMKKRKPMEIQRVPDEVLNEVKQLAKQAARQAKNAKPEKAVSAVPKWKRERDQLIQAVRAGRAYSEAIEAGLPPPPMPVAAAVEDDRVPCPHCGRRFAELTAERHIPKCLNTMGKAKPPPGAPARPPVRR